MPVNSRGVYYPDGATDANLQTILAAMADSIANNSIGAGSNAYKGTSSERSSFGLASEGDIWQDTSGEKKMWVFKSGTWVDVLTVQDTGWIALPLASGIIIHEGQTPKWRVLGDEMHLKGALKPSTGSFTTSYRDIIPSGGIPEYPGIRNGWDSVRVLPSGGGSFVGRSFIDAGGKMQVSTISGTAPYFLLNSRYVIG